MSDADTAPRAKREVVAHPVVLQEENRYVVVLRCRYQRGLADRQPGGFTRRRQVPLHQCGRDRQYVGHVVEAVLVDVVRRQEHVRVDFECQQITNGIGVFGAVQAMERFGSAGIRIDGSESIDLGFEPSGKGVVGLIRGTWLADRRHRSCAKLPDDLLPDFGLLGDP